MEHQLTFADLGLWSGKTCQEPSPPTKERTSGRSSKKLSGSPSRTLPTFHYLQRGSGRWQTPTTEMGGLLPTEFVTQSFGECPSAVVESTLSQILEDDPPPGYSLSTRACQGILTRSRRRGKPLPVELEEALVRQSASGSVEDVRGGGKGALITEEASGTLSCHNDQTIFCLGSEQGGASITRDGTSPTLTAAAGMSGNNRPVICMNDRGRSVMGVSEDVAGTLRAEVAPTVSRKFGTGGNNTPLVYTQQRFGDYRGAKAAATMTAHNGTRHTGETIAITPTVFSVDGYNQTISDTAQALRASKSDGDHVGMVLTIEGINSAKQIHRRETVRRLTPLECERLQGYPDGWTVLPRIEDMSDAGYEFWKAVLFEKAEREGKVRLSETGVWEVWHFAPVTGDSEGNWENTHKPYKHKTKKQMVAWYNRSFCEDTDSARYKAMGNSIALPSWRFVLKRISAMYEREATMASLFDGVGGFPLIWERINGQGSCLWASEIELFPIAVTRYRFGDEA